MGSLSNLYISQSYTSLIHLGSDTTITTASVELEDGLGNGIGIFVNSLGDVSITGILSASNIPADIASEAELNAYTASTNLRLNNIENTTASLNTSVTNLNAFSSSQITKDATLATYTASVDVSLSNLNSFSASQLSKDATLATYTGSNDTKWATLGGQSGSWITESETGSFAYINKDNSWSANQTFTSVTASTAQIAGLHYPTVDNGALSFLQTDGAGNLSFQYVNQILEQVRYGENISIGDPLYVSGSNGTRPVVWRADAAIAAKMPVIYIATSTNVANTNTTALTLGDITGVTTTGYPAGTTVYVGEGGGWSGSRPSGSTSIVQPLGIVTKEGAGGSGRGLVLNPGPAFLPNIQTGYAWVGNGNNQPIAVSTGSWGGGGSTDLTSLNAFTASQETKNATLASYTSSVNTQLSNLSISQSIDVQKWINISSQSGSWGIASGSVPAGTVSSSAQIVELGFLQTSSFQAYTASQDTKNATLATYTASVDTQLTNLSTSQSIDNTKWSNLGSQSGSWITESETGSFATTGANVFNGTQTVSGAVLATGNGLFGDYVSNQYPALQTKVSTTVNAGNIYSTVGIKNDNDAVGSAGIYASTFTSFGSALVAGIYGGLAGNKLAGDGGNTAIYLHDAVMEIVKDTKVSGSLSVSSSLTLNGSAVVTSAQTASFVVNTGSFATTGSNRFVGDQTITGSLLTNGSAIFGNNTSQYNNITLSSSVATYPGNIYSSIGIDTDGGGQYSAGFFVSTYTGFGSNPAFGLYGGGVGNAGSNNILESYGNLVRINKNTQLSGSLSVSSSFSAPLQQGYAYVGDASGRVSQVATSSFSGGGSTFPYTGTASISGSLQVTGSAIGNVVSMSVSSNTASMDFSKGNYFELTASVSPIRIEVSNLSGGITSTLSLIATTGSTITWSSNVQQPSGSAYTASVSGSNDILSFVAFNNSKVNVVSTLKMI